MPAPIVLSTLTPETKRVPNPPPGEPVIATDVRFRDGSRGSVPVSIPAGLIFAESFDDQPDWTADEIFVDSNTLLNENTLQNWWFGISRPTWSPKTGYPTKHAVAEVLASNVDKTRTGTGKSLVFWRESVGGGQYNSDSMQAYRLSGEGVDELYVEFYITFSNELIQAYYDGDIGGTKIFRAYHYVEGAPISEFSGLPLKPAFHWDIGGKTNGFGTRNLLSFYGRGEGASISTEDGGANMASTIQGLPNQLNNGDCSAWYTPTATDGRGVNNIDAVLTDYKNGGQLLGSPAPAPDQVFGTEAQWVKMAFYLKMNSAPGVADGAMMQWFNDQRISNVTNCMWVAAGQNMVKWNVVALGGNAQFNIYPTADQREDWYAIDDLKIYNGIPDGEGLI